MSTELSQDDSSDGAQAATNKIDWLTEELSKPHFIPRSLENEGAAGSDTAANEGAVRTTAQVEVSSSEETVNDESIADVTNADENEISLAEIKHILTMPPLLNLDEAGLRRGTRNRVPSQRAKESLGI